MQFFKLLLAFLPAVFSSEDMLNVDGNLKPFKFSVIGAGPAGLLLSYLLLKKSESITINLYETRVEFTRPQVIRIPANIARILYEDPAISQRLWRHDENRELIFDTELTPDNQPLYPKIGYRFWSFISTGHFQTVMIELLSNEFRERFTLIHSNVLERNLSGSVLANDGSDAVCCSCGGFANKVAEFDSEIEKGDGLYWVFNDNRVSGENYITPDGSELSAVKLGSRGITYAASNNELGNTQIYTYPVNQLEQHFKNMPENIKQLWQFGRGGVKLSGAGIEDESLREWFLKYKNAVLEVLNEFSIHLPDSEDDVSIFYAPRSEYYRNEAWKSGVPGFGNKLTFFVGDSLGGTDYKLGLSGGRGLLQAEFLANSILQLYGNESVSPEATMIELASKYSEYWKNVLKSEFNFAINRNQLEQVDIYYKYVMNGHPGHIANETSYEEFKRNWNELFSRNE